jgi:flagella basal body P-ring formation protein FlgA
VRDVLVYTGATVVLEIRKGGVSARVPATAEDQGARGDTIRVRLLNGDRTLRATINGRDSVRIDMGSGS